MIPVKKQVEPDDFEMKVRQKGRQWLKDHGLSLDDPKPQKLNLPPYWQPFNKVLWEKYSGTCAYLAIFFEFATGASSTDHFIPKSKKLGDAYEWDNYRLSCLGPNRNKLNFEDVLDPFELVKDSFIINFLSGKMAPAQNLSANMKRLAEATIARLDLNSPQCMKMRARHYQNYEKGECSLNFLKRHSPFVYQEICRQNLIKAGT